MQQTLLGAILRAWPDFRAAMARQMADEPGEERLLAYVFLASGLGFVAGLPGAFQQAQALGEAGSLSAVILARVISAFFFGPLFLYGLAALSHLLARALGGQGPYRTSRLALFWSLLVASPALLGFAALSVVLGPQMGAAPGLVVLGLFLWIWASSLAEGTGLRSQIPLFLVFLTVPSAVLSILLIPR